MMRHLGKTLSAIFTVALFTVFSVEPIAAQDSENPLSIVTGPLNSGTLTVTCGPGPEVIGVLDVYSQSCTVSGGSGIYSWSVTGLPASFTKPDENGPSMTISGIPYHRATNTLIVTAMDASQPSATGTTILTVVAQPGLAGAAR